MSPGTRCEGAALAGPGNSAARRSLGGRAAGSASSARGSFPRLHLLRGDPRGSRVAQQKGAPRRARRPAPPRPAPLPASAPASPRESLPRHRLQVPGRGRGRGDNNSAGGRAGGRRGKARRRAPRQRGAGLRAVPPRHWSAPPLRPPLIGDCSNSVSRRQRRCFSGDRGPGLELAKAGRITLLTDGRTDAASWLAGLAGWLESGICEPGPALSMSPAGR